MGWGRVIPAPPAPINTVRVQKREKEAKEKKTAEKKGKLRERNRLCRERNDRN